MGQHARTFRFDHRIQPALRSDVASKIQLSPTASAFQQQRRFLQARLRVRKNELRQNIPPQPRSANPGIGVVVAIAGAGTLRQRLSQLPDTPRAPPPSRQQPPDDSTTRDGQRNQPTVEGAAWPSSQCGSLMWIYARYVAGSDGGACGELQTMALLRCATSTPRRTWAFRAVRFWCGQHQLTGTGGGAIRDGTPAARDQYSRAPGPAAPPAPPRARRSASRGDAQIVAAVAGIAC